MEDVRAVTCEALHDAHRETRARAAVGVGRRFAGASAQSGEVGDQAGDRVAARVIGAENLRQEGPQGDQGRNDSLASADPFGGEGLSDGVGIEQIGPFESLTLLRTDEVFGKDWRASQSGFRQACLLTDGAQVGGGL